MQTRFLAGLSVGGGRTISRTLSRIRLCARLCTRGGGMAARGFCRVAVVEAAAAAVRIKAGSWGVASVEGPDMLHGKRWVADIFLTISRCSMQLRVVGHDAVRSPVSTADMLGAEPVSSPCSSLLVWRSPAVAFAALSSPCCRRGPPRRRGRRPPWLADGRRPSNASRCCSPV